MVAVACGIFSAPDDYETLKSELDELRVKSKIVLFMKGNRRFPICGLSSDVCYMLRRCNMDFSTVDLLCRPNLSLFMRAMHEPISAPYLYAGGKFVGGYETICAMYDSGLLGSLIRWCPTISQTNREYFHQCFFKLFAPIALSRLFSSITFRRLFFLHGIYVRARIISDAEFRVLHCWFRR